MDNTLIKIFNHVDKQENGCWEWTRCLNTDGYPRMNYKGNVNGKVHRIVMELLGNDITGKVVRHKCDNPKCLNPEHLELGTISDNCNDMVIRGRYYKQVTDLEIKSVKALLESGLRGFEVATVLGITSERVYYIRAKYAAHTGGL